MKHIDSLLKFDPYSLAREEKLDVFMPAMKEALSWHIKNSQVFDALSSQSSFSLDDPFKMADIPYIPVPVFKTTKLISISDGEVKSKVASSGTSGKKSTVYFDDVTSHRQRLALTKIMTNFLGKERRYFIVFDAASTIDVKKQGMSSRGGAIRGMLGLSKGFSTVLTNNLQIDVAQLEAAIAKAKDASMPICLFGFTWLMYQSVSKQPEKFPTIKKLLDNYDVKLLHIGGWKKLQDLAVDKATFNKGMEETIGVLGTNCIDFYGMTEQLGTVYPDCEMGFKHAPTYADIIIRHTVTLEPQPINQEGFIQLISPLPHSYPGISILSDDIGVISGEDDCGCGRKGKYFKFLRRADAAEVKGCGDTIDL